MQASASTPTALRYVRGSWISTGAPPRRATIAAAASSPLVTADSIVVIPIRLSQ